MADKDFVVKNGLVVNSNVLVVNGTNVGVNTATPDALFVVAGTANLQGNVKMTGSEINVTSNVTVYGNTEFKNNVYIDKKLYVGNTDTMVQNLPTVIQAVDNFNGFVMVSSQNLSIEDDACADLLIYSDNTNGLTYFNDVGINNSRFDGRIHRIIVNTAASSWSLGEIVYQRNSAGANIAVGEIRDKVAIPGNSTAISLKIRVSEDDGLFAPLVDMADFVNTAASNLSLYATTSGTNAAILHAVGFFSTEIIEGYSRRNYGFTIGKRGDGYLYNANSALTIGTTRGGIRQITETISTSFSSGANVIVMSSGNTLNIKPDMNVFGTSIDTGTYITSIVNSTAFRLSKVTTGSLASGTITARDEFYDLTEANNPIIFHVGGMMGKNEIARFSGTGNFTIGPNTTNRDSKLTVNGTANLVGQVNVSANVNVVGNINATANVQAARGVFTTNVIVGDTYMNATTFVVGNTTANANVIEIDGNTTVSTSILRSGNLTIGNGTVTDSALVQIQNSSFSANMSPGTFRTGISTVNGTVVSVGANVFANATTVSVGNTLINVTMSQNTTAVLQVVGNATISANLTTANLIITNQIVGQANVTGNVNVTGNINATANVNGVRGVFSTSVNVASVVGIGTQVDVASNVTLDAAGLKITGNTLIPSMNVSGGNITVGNSTVANSPTVSLVNSISSANMTPAGLQTGGIVVNALGSTINVGANVWLNATTFAIGNSSANVVIDPSDAGQVLSVGGDARVNGNLLVKGNATVDGTMSFADSVTLDGDIIPASNDSFDFGNSSLVWSAAYIKVIQVPATGNVTVGNSSLNAVSYFDSVRISNSSGSFANLNISSLTVGNTSVNGQYTSADTRIGTTAGNSVLNSTSLVIGNSSVNSTVNSSAFLGNVVATTISGNLTGNVAATTITGNLTGNVAAVTISGNLTGNVVATTISGNLTGNVVATTISGNLTGNVIATNIDAVTINATTINATTFQVGTAFIANSTSVSTTDLIITGNLQVSGTTTFVNTATMDVKDKNITLAKGAANPAAANGGGITLEGASAELVYISATNTWLSNVDITVGNSTSNVVISATALTGNTSGVHLGNVIATTINGNLTGNVVATTISASDNVTVGANVLINTSAVSLSNSSAVSLQNASLVRVGNSTIVTAPQVVVQNTAGATTINTNFISTTSLSGNLTGNVSATTLTGNLTGNVVATTISASASIVLGSNVVANTTGNFSSHLGGFPAADYVKFSASGDVSLADGGTNSSIATAVAGGIVFSNATGMAITAVGTAGQLLESSAASTPVWRSPSVLTVGNSSNLGGVAAASYQLNSTLSANVATMTANNSTNLGGTAAASYQLNSTLAANVATMSANNASFLGTTAAASYQLNSTLAANVATMTSLNTNNALFLGGTAAASYQLNSTLASNVATMAANSSTFLNGQAASFYTNAGNMSTGTLLSARISGSYTGITGVGTLAAGVWNGSTIAVTYGGTGGTTAATARANLEIKSMALRDVTITTSGSPAGGVSGDIWIQYVA